MKTNYLQLLRAAGFTILCLGLFTCASAQSVSGQVNSAASTAAATVEEAGKTAGTKLEQLWQQIDAQRLKNRSWDEIVAWLIMGLLIGGLMGRGERLPWWMGFVFGLIGAFIGGVVVHLSQWDLGLGPVLIRYEDLLFSLGGGAVVIWLARRFGWPRKKTS